MLRIGFVGVGVMGQGMASNLLAAGYPLIAIAHRNRAPIEAIVDQGAMEAGSYQALAENSDVIMLCVSNSDVVEQVIAALTPFFASGNDGDRYRHIEPRVQPQYLSGFKKSLRGVCGSAGYRWN